MAQALPVVLFSCMAMDREILIRHRDINIGYGTLIINLPSSVVMADSFLISPIRLWFTRPLFLLYNFWGCLGFFLW